MKKISEFLSENFQFLVVKFSIYLNRRVFIMVLGTPYLLTLLVLKFEIVHSTTS